VKNIMNVIIVVHTEFGYVNKKNVIFEKRAVDGVKVGVQNIIKIADKYGAKLTFAVMPEVVDFFPKDIKHEVGLHVHPGWRKVEYKSFTWYVGDKYLLEHCKTSINSTVLRDYPFKEQVELIETGRDLLQDKLKVEPKVFVAGRWSENNDTIKALIKAKFTHDFSPPAHQKASHFDWSKLPRICMPYHPSDKDYQEKGNLPLLIVPISQVFPIGSVNPEIAPLVGISWLKACFLEYYNQSLPLFHICLHSPSMTDPYFCSVMDELLKFISKYDVEFKFGSEVKSYGETKARTNIFPYLTHLNGKTIMLALSTIFERIKTVAY